jgi:15-cis-phytoene synthase
VTSTFPPSDVGPAGDLAACRAALATGSRTFWAASLLLPRKVRDPATALYAFCRAADDAIDMGGGADALADLYDRLDAAYAGCPRETPVDRAFARTVAAYGIPFDIPAALIEGMAWDTQGRRYATLGDLNAYAARVAGTVGVMMALLMGVRDPVALARACDLGVAMQLSNIARDVGEDARAGRLYLPQDWLRGAGIDPDGFLADPRWTPALEGVVADLLDAADRLYRRSESGIERLPPACRPAIFAARFLYAGIGEAAGRLGADLLDRRAVVPGGRKARLVGRALVRTLLVSGTADGPPLPETRFLVEAAASRQADDGVFEGRLARVIVMFARLARTDAPAG